MDAPDFRDVPIGARAARTLAEHALTLPDGHPARVTIELLLARRDGAARSTFGHGRIDFGGVEVDGGTWAAMQGADHDAAAAEAAAMAEAEAVVAYHEGGGQ